MIAWRDIEIGVHAEKPGSAPDNDAGFFLDFSQDRLSKRFAPLDAAAGEIPAGPITMTHHKDFIAIPHDQCLRAKRHASAHAPEGENQRPDKPCPHYVDHTPLFSPGKPLPE